MVKNAWFSQEDVRPSVFCRQNSPNLPGKYVENALPSSVPLAFESWSVDLWITLFLHEFLILFWQFQQKMQIVWLLLGITKHCLPFKSAHKTCGAKYPTQPLFSAVKHTRKNRSFWKCCQMRKFEQKWTKVSEASWYSLKLYVCKIL